MQEFICDLVSQLSKQAAEAPCLFSYVRFMSNKLVSQLVDLPLPYNFGCLGLKWLKKKKNATILSLLHLESEQSELATGLNTG